ncbi:hypothetical protein L5L78_08610 [Shewanella sp. SM34]|uniref:hypothetical protein n=1 Tax=unclassified Shewanella TaxID=196818 RepID=UPI0021D8A932|nr:MULTISPECIES: hypothetical protein [unclassified Shewanella]MCU8056262.1 hypothetical protein [Shewanella sp. SM35]MCU8065196.1 hypothetical protein [Shewanella sp. SM34]
MQIGQKYLAVSEAYSFEDLDGSLVEFPERRREFEVLPKPDVGSLYPWGDLFTPYSSPTPEKVITDDGQHKTIENYT